MPRRDGGAERAKGRERVAQNRSTARTRAEIGTYATRGGQLEQLSAIGESFNATFVNPVVNAVGRAAGRNPNLRQAGPVEAAVNTLGFAGGPVGRVVGRGVARGVQAGVRRFAPQLTQDVGVHFSRNPNIQGQITASVERLGSGKGPSVRNPVLPDKTYKFSGYGPTLGSPTRTGETLSPGHFQNLMSGKDTAYVTRSRLGRVDPESPALAMGPQVQDWFSRGGKYQSQRVTGSQQIREVVTPQEYYSGALGRAVERERAILAAERQATVTISGRAGGVAGGAVGAWQNQRRSTDRRR